jgi:type IV pilus assembly protein PilY1
MPPSVPRTRKSLATRLAPFFSLIAFPLQAAPIDLADAPLFSASAVPGNLALALSVEWPTAHSTAYPSTPGYSTATAYYGYFDPGKCYVYRYDADTPESSYFAPHSTTATRTCNSSASAPLWSGNFLNWASMHALDTFRQALTGGQRSVDTTDMTVLQRAYSNGRHDPISQGSLNKTPNKTLVSGVSGATPFNWPTLVTRTWGGGVKMWFTSQGSIGNNTVEAEDYRGHRRNGNGNGNGNSRDQLDPDKVYAVYIRVKVCDAAVGLEPNCVRYGSHYKPEGLLQSYSMKLRYSTFGFLNSNVPDFPEVQRDGGVMRARMKYIGPWKPELGAPNSSNTAAEWDAATGIMRADPDAADSAATANRYGLPREVVRNSGVMNYLNLFGQAARSYKSTDPVSELYYAAQRYLRRAGNVHEYTSMAGLDRNEVTKQVDGFPVIEAWDDPIEHSCQKNFILGIGDVNTHRDANLPGSRITSSAEPPMPRAVQDDVHVNVTTATNAVGAREGISNLGGRFMSGRMNTYFIAGLAYDAHTRDIRPDLPGKQTISTYWMDVMEGQEYLPRNQYWLATKYGGFAVPNGFSPYEGTDPLPESTWSTTGDTLPDGRPRPDNYFTAGQADKMVQGLTNAFARIASEISSASSATFETTSRNLTSLGGIGYSATYDPRTWTGDVTAERAQFDSSGQATRTRLWSASSLLDQTDPDRRRIVTCCTPRGDALPFRANTLASGPLGTRTNFRSFDNVPGVDADRQSAANFVSYLRGSRAQELANGGAYRTRAHLLGDIVNSRIKVVGAPNAGHDERLHPGYNSFRRTHRDRKTVVFAGANDGMLHAFDGSTSPNGGKELFAYVPSFAYGDNRTARESGLASLGNPSYQHRNFVDGQISVFDVDFARTHRNATTGNDWRSVLIAGLGKGGRGYFAIDVTNPSSWTDESAVASKVLWEFTDHRMGYSYGDAVLAKTVKYGWVVVLTSGYNNSDGRGYFFLVNPKTGDLLEAVATPEGDRDRPINMAYATSFQNGDGDAADVVYAADMQGNLWRLDLTKRSGDYDAPTKIARFTDSRGNPQPVTTAPRVLVHPSTGKRYVLVGTGRMLADSDLSDAQQQTFYAIIDGTAQAFFDARNAPTGHGLPIRRADLTENRSLLDGVPDGRLGWYFDLGHSPAGTAERITVMPVFNNGIVAFAANLPNVDPCSPGGTSRQFAIELSNGRTALLDADGNAVASVASPSLATSATFTNVDGTIRLHMKGSDGNMSSPCQGSDCFAPRPQLRRLNWREVRGRE